MTMRLKGSQVARELLALLAQWTKLFDLTAQADELLAIDFRLLQLAQDGLIDGFRSCLSFVPTLPDRRQIGIHPAQDTRELLCQARNLRRCTIKDCS